MTPSLALALLLAAGPPAAGPPAPTEPVHPLRLELLVSPTFGMEDGLRDVLSVERALFLYDDLLARGLDFDESGWRRLAGILGRLAKFLLVDTPIVTFLNAVQHEVFGHGARAREFGQWPQYLFGLPLPYSLLAPGQDYSGFAYFGTSGLADRDLPMVFGGIEANAYAGHLVAMTALRGGGSLHYGDALHYLVSRLGYLPRWLSPDVIGRHTNSDDPDQYAQLLAVRFNRFGSSAQVELSQRLRRAWATQFLDPLWWYCAYDLIVEYVGQGRRWWTVPRLQVGGVALLPAVRFSLGPFGAEHALDVTFGTPRFLLDVSVRAASSGLATSVGAGARLFEFQVLPTVAVGGSLDVWIQPELLPEYRNAYDGRTLPGVSAMVEASWRPFEHWAFVGQLGGKTRGYVMSQPTQAGVFGFAGVQLYVDR